MNLKDKVCIVTGGAMGNGLGIVEVFLDYGAKVIIFDYSDEVFNTIDRMKNPNLSGYKVDIRDKEKINSIVSEIIRDFGRIDVLVNNAGICNLEKFVDMSDEERDRHFDINIVGTWNVTKAVVPNMIQNKYGKIVNLSSVTGPMVADSGEVAYATTKSAIMGFTKSLAMELVTEGITVNAIMPGYILTPLVENMAKVSNPEDPDSVIKGIEDGIPMGRMGTIREIGELAAFLGSDSSSYITGQGIVIDGASTLPETKTMGV